ncbi:MAG: Dps family protein [Prochloraceae cyanobacterium]
MATKIETNTQTNLDTKVAVEQQNHLVIAEGLFGILADTYTLYMKTQKFHWNVTGALFYAVHSLTEQQYKEMASAIDEIAERIRAIGFPAPGSYSEFMQLSSISETQDIPTAHNMILQLVKGNEAIVRYAKEIVQQAEEANDVATADLLTQRIAVHQKNVWMLRSLIG